MGSGRAGTGRLFFPPLTEGLRHFLLPKIRLPNLHLGLAFGATGKLGLFGRLGALYRLPKLLILLKIICFWSQSCELQHLGMQEAAVSSKK